MPGAEPRPSLLAALRVRSQASLEAAAAASLPIAQRIREIDRELAAAYRWLTEAFAHLDAIRPPVAHRFALGPGTDLAPLAWERGFVSFRRGLAGGHDVLAQVDGGYRLAGEGAASLPASPGDVAAAAERMRVAQLEFDFRPDRSRGSSAPAGSFAVVRAVAAAVRFVPDYRRGVVAATLANVDRLESVTLEFPAGALGEPALEDLVRLVLGESDAFLRRAPLAGFGGRTSGLL